MTAETVKKAIELDSEIRELKQYARVVSNGNYNRLAFYIEAAGKLQYDNAVSWDEPLNIFVDKRHNKRLFAVIDEIIAELEKELEEL